MEYDDSSPLQEPIPSDSFYTRRAYNCLFGSVTVCISLSYLIIITTQHETAAQP